MGEFEHITELPSSSVVLNGQKGDLLYYVCRNEKKTSTVLTLFNDSEETQLTDIPKETSKMKDYTKNDTTGDGHSKKHIVVCKKWKQDALSLLKEIEVTLVESVHFH